MVRFHPRPPILTSFGLSGAAALRHAADASRPPAGTIPLQLPTLTSFGLSGAAALRHAADASRPPAGTIPPNCNPHFVRSCRARRHSGTRPTLPRPPASTIPLQLPTLTSFGVVGRGGTQARGQRSRVRQRARFHSNCNRHFVRSCRARRHSGRRPTLPRSPASTIPLQLPTLTSFGLSGRGGTQARGERSESASGPDSTSTSLRSPRSGNAIPQVQVPAALEDYHNPGLVESAGAQTKQKRGCFLPVSARDLKATRPDVLGEDGQGNAQGRLPELVLLIDRSRPC